MEKFKRIMVWHPVGDPQQMPILRGISDYARKRRNWALEANPEMFGGGLRDVIGWPGHGLIGVIRSKAEIAAARALKIPVINLSGALRDATLPRVMVDQAAMGRMAAEHLLACGLSHFAYYGEREMWYSQQRKDGFRQRLAESGFSCEVFDASTRFGHRNPWYRWLEPVKTWLKSLQLPTGLLAVHDYAGAMLVEACLRVGLRVPQDIALIGVGNDPITCEFCTVSLSSISRNNREVGYRAAALLDRLMAGQRPPKGDLLIPPEGVIRRRSTEVLIVSDRHLQAAVDYIQDHLAQRLCVADLCRRLAISHRLLDLLFKRHLDCSPREFLCRMRVERAKQLLLARENAKLQELANACGFSGVRHFRAAFKRLTGKTPVEYRRQG
jgi:LacI family transcriptional regulator